MSHEVDRATFFHNMRGGKGYMTGNPLIDARGPFRERPQAPRPVIGRWEAEAYVTMKMQDLTVLAERCGFTVGRTPGSKRALEVVRGDFREEIHRRYIVIE